MTPARISALSHGELLVWLMLSQCSPEKPVILADFWLTELDRAAVRDGLVMPGQT